MAGSVNGGGIHPSSHFSSTTMSYKPSNSAGLSSGGLGGSGAGGLEKLRRKWWNLFSTSIRYILFNTKSS